MHTSQPPFFLQTDRLGFRRWRDADLDLAKTLWGDLDVTRRIGGPFCNTQIEARLQREIAQQASHGVQYWPIFVLDDLDFVGCCGLRPYPAAHQVFELGFHLRPAFQRRGLATEAARATIAHAFDALHARALFAGHHPDNAASSKALLRLGFRYERDEFYEPTGRMHPSYLLTRSDILATNPAN